MQTDCDAFGSRCQSPQHKYVFKNETKSIYKVCFYCFKNMGAVKKSGFKDEIEADFAQFAELRKEHEKKRHEEWRKENEYKQRLYLVKKIESDEFYNSDEWRRVRFIVLEQHFRKMGKKACLLCGATHAKLHVDHIKPRSKYPELALEISNLQVLCEACNLGKSNTSETDFREWTK